jgi:hypothetical protein
MQGIDLYYKKECVLDDVVHSEVQYSTESPKSIHRLRLADTEVASAVCTWDKV